MRAAGNNRSSPMKRAIGIVIFCITLLTAENPAQAAVFRSPHDLHNGIGCSSCHTFINPPGPHATKAATNYDLCKNCHNVLTGNFFPFEDSFRNYTVGLSGAFHKWNVYTSNPTFGASAPTNPEMAKRIENGKIVCSVCHDQHNNNPANQSAGRLHKSDVFKENDLGGTGVISFTPAPGAPPMGYTVEIIAGGDENSATYRVSYRGGSSWFGWDQSLSTWVPYNNNARTASGSTPQNLDRFSYATITFGAGTYIAGERWKFHFTYPFLRAYPDVGDNSAGKRFCRDCHSQRAQTHYAGRNRWDGTVKSHPVGVSLNSNGGGYDRKPLDVDGVRQGLSSDGNSTNNLLLFQGVTSMATFGNISSGDVQCMTCHAPHWTDSNSMTEDRR